MQNYVLAILYTRFSNSFPLFIKLGLKSLGGLVNLYFIYDGNPGLLIQQDTINEIYFFNVFFIVLV